MSAGDERAPASASDDQRAPASAGDRAPLFGRWAGWYALLIVELIGIIVFCGWLAAQNG